MKVMVTKISAVLLILAGSAGVSIRLTNVFARGSAILKLQKSGGNRVTLMLTLNSPQSSSVIKSKMAASTVRT